MAAAVPTAVALTAGPRHPQNPAPAGETRETAAVRQLVERMKGAGGIQARRHHLLRQRLLHNHLLHNRQRLLHNHLQSLAQQRRSAPERLPC
jgi:uncharacterized membrane protein YccC